MRPGFVGYWNALTRVQKNRMRDYVEKYVSPGGWPKIKEWMNEERRNSGLKGDLRDSCKEKDFILAMTEKLSDHASVVVLAPQEG